MSKTRLVDYLWDKRYPCSLGDKQELQRPGWGMRGIKAFETCLGVTQVGTRLGRSLET